MCFSVCLFAYAGTGQQINHFFLDTCSSGCALASAICLIFFLFHAEKAKQWNYPRSRVFPLRVIHANPRFLFLFSSSFFFSKKTEIYVLGVPTLCVLFVLAADLLESFKSAEDLCVKIKDFKWRHDNRDGLVISLIALVNEPLLRWISHDIHSPTIFSKKNWKVSFVELLSIIKHARTWNNLQQMFSFHSWSWAVNLVV